MSVIEASSVSVKTMADGTLRVSFDVMPAHAQAAFALFGAPGTPSALAALKTNAQKAREAEATPPPAPEPEKRKGGPISQWLALRCKEREFRHWLCEIGDGGEWHLDEAGAIDIVREMCGVKSRADIDGDEMATAKFRQRIQGPWSKHCVARGVTA